MPRRINYKLAAAAGVIIWALVAICFGGLLIQFGLTFNKPTLLQQVAMFLLLALYVLFGFIVGPIEGGKPIISFILNGALWGLIAALVFNKISARRDWRKPGS